MLSTPFLRSIAKAFASQKKCDMKDYCFVFPNRRSGTYFAKEIVDLNEGAFIMPQITTISDLLSDFTHLVEAGRIELLLDLYSEYRNILAGNADSFDKFVFWGDIVLSDFNDVDRYLVDAQSLFRNIKELKEIGTDYLTDEQREVLSQYFGESVFSSDKYINEFWKHVKHESGETKGETVDSYLKLWEVLWLLYEAFNNRLESKGLSYSGAIYRRAVKAIKDLDVEKCDYKKYIFIGFNVLSTSEYEIFNALKNKGIADFYWDCNSPALNDDNNKASLFVKRNIRNFPSELVIDEDPITTFPDITVAAIPANLGQIKYTTSIISTLIKNGDINDLDSPTDTAIVLPDESLFLPLISSIPQQIKEVNITMGYPMNNSSISALISSIAKLHKQARIIQGEYCFYHEDIKMLFSHPYLRRIPNQEIDSLLQYILKNNLFFVTCSKINEICPSLSLLFMQVGTKSKTDLIAYVNNILTFIERSLMDTFGEDGNPVERSFVEKYIESFNELVAVINDYDIEMNDDTFFFLVDRFVSISAIAFEGEPLKGLQIMGILETRSLDFDNLIILSMNEHIFPSKHFTRSFIPNNLRRGFSMATMEYQECIYAYYFYRMISRAKNVFLLYDARSQGIGYGEPSRYIHQLEKLHPECDIRYKYPNFNVKAPKEITISVRKTDRIMRLLNAFRDPVQKEKKRLSPSSINMYINCPLQFYLANVEGLKIDDDITEFMSSGIFGQIIHSIMENLYLSVPANSNGERLVTNNNIDKLLKENASIDRNIKRAVNEFFYKKGKECFDDLHGEGFLLEGVIAKYVRDILQFDKNQDFVFLNAELKDADQWKIAPGLTINYTQIIDRVDRISSPNGDVIRLIDYKTGSDHASFRSIDEIFDSSRPDRQKAIVQVFLYCNYYSKKYKITGSIKPMIYKVSSLRDADIKCGKEIVDDYRSYNQEFMKNFEGIITDLFDKNVRFTQAKSEKTCDYCKYKDFCRK